MSNFIVLILLFTFSFNAISSTFNDSLKEEERLLYDEYSKVRGEIDAFTTNEKGFLLSKASNYAEDAYADSASNSKYSFFRVSGSFENLAALSYNYLLMD